MTTGHRFEQDAGDIEFRPRNRRPGTDPASRVWKAARDPRRMLAACLLAPVLLGVIASCDSRSERYQVYGTVTLDGAPAAGIVVRLTFNVSPGPFGLDVPDRESAEETTDGEGTYSFHFNSTASFLDAIVEIATSEGPFSTISWNYSLGRAEVEFDTSRVERVDFVGNTILAAGVLRVDIQDPPDQTSVVANADIQFLGSAVLFDEDGVIVLEIPDSLIWTSNLDGEIGQGASFVRTLSTGAHTIVATAAIDTAGLTRTAVDSVHITVTEAPAGACDDFGLRVDFTPIEIAAGTSDVVATFVDRVGSFAGSVELLLAAGAGGTEPSEVMSAATFQPRIVQFAADPDSADTLASTLTFTVRNDVSAGQQFELSIVGGSPSLETDPNGCRLPVTFEVIG